MSKYHNLKTHVSDPFFPNTFSNAMFQLVDVILERLGRHLDALLEAFSDFVGCLTHFLKIMPPCGWELKKQGFGITKMSGNRI